MLGGGTLSLTYAPGHAVLQLACLGCVIAATVTYSNNKDWSLGAMDLQTLLANLSHPLELI